ncbi:MAG: hypothetical protein HRU13_02200 [Phycisphaerales bacterium]|nr:hypothetical protein [Phycisphaerales bacterium]
MSSDYPEYMSGIDTSPPEGVREALRRGIKAVEDGHGGDGLEAATVREARALARGELPTLFKIDKGRRFTARNARFADAEVNSPAWVAWQLWGAGAGARWFASLWSQIETAREEAGVKTADDPAKTPAAPDERRRGSTRNPQGSAGGSRGGITIDEATERALRRKIDAHNDEHTAKSKRADMGTLKAVYRRGAGAFSTSHRPGMSRNQWSMARVNAFLYLLRNGRPEKATYTTDDDLLPEGHPKAKKEAAAVDDAPATVLGESDVRWILAFPWGEGSAGEATWVVDEAFAQRLSDNLARQRSDGYRPPVARQHQEDGFTYGKVFGTRAEDDGVFLGVEFAEGWAARYDGGLLGHWSPGFYPDGWVDSHSGAVYEGPVLREFSFVTVPQQKVRTGQAHYTLAEQTPGEPTTTGAQAMDMEKMMERLAALEERLESMGDMEKMMERLAALEDHYEEMQGRAEAEDDEGEEDDDDESGEVRMSDTPEFAAIAARLQVLEEENTRLSVKASAPHASEEDVAHLVKMGEEQRAWAISLMARSAQAETGRTGAAVAPPSASTPASVVSLAESARREGVARGQELISYVRQKGGLSFIDAAAAIANASAEIDRIYA